MYLRPHRVVILRLRIQPGSPRGVQSLPVSLYRSHFDFDLTERVSRQNFEQRP